MDALDRLHADIDARVHTIRIDAPDWPCAKGCDECCRRLAGVPVLTPAEWQRLRDSLARLSAEAQERIRHNVLALAAAAPTAPIVCPLLDRDSGACPVYAARPTACRTYGFYVQRDGGLYCQTIEARVVDGDFADTVWGNQDAVDGILAGMGEARPMTTWFLSPMDSLP